MLNRIFGSMLIVAAATTGAMAADLPSRSYPPVYVPPPQLPTFTWTGFYVGGQVGYEFGHDHSVGFATGVGGIGAAGASTSGVIGGAHVGYNYAVPSFGGLGGVHLVFGVEGDVDGSNTHAAYALGPIATSLNQNIQGSVRGRLGIAVDRVLFYATGGAAIGDLSNNYFNALNGLSDSASHTRLGYTVGGGVEYAITNNWSLRAEYRRTDFGRVSDTLVNSTDGGVTVRNHEIENRAQLGFSYKFDMFSPVSSPVVARY